MLVPMWLYTIVAVVVFAVVLATEGLSAGMAICLGVAIAASGGVVMLARKNPKRAR